MGYGLGAARLWGMGSCNKKSPKRVYERAQSSKDRKVRAHSSHALNSKLLYLPRKNQKDYYVSV